MMSDDESEVKTKVGKQIGVTFALYSRFNCTKILTDKHKFTVGDIYCFILKRLGRKLY